MSLLKVINACCTRQSDLITKFSWHAFCPVNYHNYNSKRDVIIQISTTEARSPICAERSTFLVMIIGERAKRARHSQVCSIENRGYIYYILLYIVHANLVLITRKEGGA